MGLHNLKSDDLFHTAQRAVVAAVGALGREMAALQMWTVHGTLVICNSSCFLCFTISVLPLPSGTRSITDAHLTLPL